MNRITNQPEYKYGVTFVPAVLNPDALNDVSKTILISELDFLMDIIDS